MMNLIYSTFYYGTLYTYNSQTCSKSTFPLLKKLNSEMLFLVNSVKISNTKSYVGVQKRQMISH